MSFPITIFARHYNIIPEQIKALVGFESDNFLISSSGMKYVAKIYSLDLKKMELLQAENTVLDFLVARSDDTFSRVVYNIRGEGLTCLEEDKIMIRVLEYVEGEVFSKVSQSQELWDSLGSFVGRLDKCLSDFESNRIRSREIYWDLNHTTLYLKHFKAIKDLETSRVVHYFLNQFKERVLPVRYELRQGVIHNDINDYNVLVRKNEVSGVIDFGDLAYSSIIAEIAIVCAYAAMGQPDPLKVSALILEAYCKEFPLTEIEVDVLYYFIAARLCVSLCESWMKRPSGEDTEYALVSERPASLLIHRWLGVNPIGAKRVFRTAAGLKVDPIPPLKEVLTRRSQHFSDVMSLSYSKPIHMTGAAFQYMYDSKGDTFLDAYNNIMLVGHCHPRVVEAGQKMMSTINTNTRYLYDILLDYAERLLAFFPSHLNRLFLVNSGSAASDLALRIARAHTGHEKISVVQHGYHGNTSLAIDLSHYKYAHKGGKGKKEFVIESELPDVYRGRFKGENAGLQYAQLLIDKLKDSELAAFIAEPIVGCGGQVPLADGFLEAVYPAVRARGGLCISDEVQVGFGRLGSSFWGYEQHGIIPDIVILGKPMGNGHPVGAVVTTEEIAASFDNGMEFFSSFGGNPVTCAITNAVLEVMEDEGLQQSALVVGRQLYEGLTALSLKDERIGDIRGNGLFLGVDFVHAGKEILANTALAQQVKNELKNRGVLTSTDGPFDNVLKIKPPLCFSRENADELLEKLSDILRQSKP